MQILDDTLEVLDYNSSEGMESDIFEEVEKELSDPHEILWKVNLIYTPLRSAFPRA
jgi:hypothetical protein